MTKYIPSNPALAGWCFDEELIKEATAGERLLNPSMDLGSVCDLNCPYCFTVTGFASKQIKHPREMIRTEVLAVLRDLAGAGARTVNIVGAGEPLLDPILPSFVEEAMALGITVVLFTNGTKLSTDPHLARFLFDHGVTVVLKYNSRSKELQDTLVARRGYSEKRDKALDILIDIGFNAVQPTRLAIDTLVFAGNLDELPGIHRWCRNENIYPLTSDFIPNGRTINGDVREPLEKTERGQGSNILAAQVLKPITREQKAELIRTLADIDIELGIEQDGTRAYYGGGVCTQLLGVYVDVEGIIWPCVAQRRLVGPSKKPLGSIRSGNMPSEVWRESPYMEWVRKTYTGACPYKAPLSVPTLSRTVPHVTVSDGRSRS